MRIRAHGRVDNNHRQIVTALRDAGRSVLDLSGVGKGCPDILVGFHGVNVLLEIKSAKGDLTEPQEKFFASWRGQRAVVRTIAEAIDATRR